MSGGWWRFGRGCWWMSSRCVCPLLPPRIHPCLSPFPCPPTIASHVLLSPAYYPPPHFPPSNLITPHPPCTHPPESQPAPRLFASRVSPEDKILLVPPPSFLRFKIAHSSSSLSTPPRSPNRPLALLRLAYLFASFAPGGLFWSGDFDCRYAMRGFADLTFADSGGCLD